MSHKGLDERPEVAHLTDEELLARVTQARERVCEADLDYDRAVTDAMVRGLNQSLIAEAAGVTRRALHKTTDREWQRRQPGVE
jgi:hypothetical protein